jgi:iron complex transport system ATP-binding protein
MSAPKEPLLAVTNLSVTLGRHRILHDLSFSIGGGELVALIGANGSGKTTLLRAALGLLPFGGTVAWQGDPGAVFHARTLARMAAYLPQSPTAIPGQTVAQAILLGRHACRGTLEFADTAEDCRVLGEAARAIGVDQFFDRTLEQLSGGQRQRVFLARCLAQESPVLLLDEPATFLDLRHQVELYQLLRRLVREHRRTILMAAHDLNLAAMHADRMILLDGGKLVADGTPDELMTPETIGAAFGVRMRRIEVDGRPHLVPVE